jgi:1-acyl-sn-glycerol-3-phosphate acyltransferase
MTPRYPALPIATVAALAWTVLRGRRRSFRSDALRWSRGLALEVHGTENIPSAGPGLLVINHYHRPGFRAWWFALALSAVVPAELLWTLTSAWTDDGTPGARARALISPRIFPRLARAYGFISMPPMPPRPGEVAGRAGAVRALVAAARRRPTLLLALAPEGMDNPRGPGMLRLPSGAGRLLAAINQAGHPIYPVGVSENNTALVLAFGVPFELRLSPGNSEQEAAAQVGQAIAALLPPVLRGDYGLDNL